MGAEEWIAAVIAGCSKTRRNQDDFIVGWLRHKLQEVRRFVKIVLHGAFDTSTPEGRSDERLRRIALSAMTFGIARVFSMIIPLVTVGLSLRYLGKEVYGLWMTITSFFAMFAFADFGLGNGLLTSLSRSWGKDDVKKSRELTSSAFFLLLFIATGISVVFLLSFPFIPWSWVLGAESEGSQKFSAVLVAAVVIPQLLQLPFSMIQRTQMALQEAYRNNLWQCAGSFVSLTGVVMVVHYDLGAVTLVAVASSVTVLIWCFNWLWCFGVERPMLRPSWSCFNKETAQALMKTGGAFFLLSILTTIGLAVDNIIVAHTCGLPEVSGFSVASRVASILGMAVGMICMPMWAANGEALAKGEVEWVRRVTNRLVWLSASIAACGGIGLVLVGPWVFKIWLGDRLGIISIGLLLGLAFQQLVLSIASPYFMVLNGSGAVRIQIWMFALYVPASIVLKIMASFALGSAGIPWAMVLAYGLIILPIVYLKSMHICKAL